MIEIPAAVVPLLVIGLVALLAVAVLLAIWLTNDYWRKDAVARNKAEYYVGGLYDKPQWRWKRDPNDSR